MTQIATQCRNFLSGLKTTAQQPELMQLLEPLCIIDIGFAPRHLLDLPGVDQQNGVDDLI